jgi:hypothetical protein
MNRRLVKEIQVSLICDRNEKQTIQRAGHILRMPRDRLPKVALRWTPRGRENLENYPIRI